MLLLLACSQDPTPPPATPSEGPLVLAIHGMGDSPDGFERVWIPQDDYQELTPPGIHPYGNGYRWFNRRSEGLRDADIAAAAEHLAALIPDKAIVYGFSQGGALTMTLVGNTVGRKTMKKE